VISGHADRIELAADLAKNAGAKRAIMLNVSGAFHSELMAPAKEKLREVLAGIPVNEPAIDFISNIDAKVTRSPEDIKKNLVDQLDNKTLWEDSVKNAVASGITEYIEVGPGNVLKGLGRKIDEKINVVSLHTSSEIDAFINGVK